ncbi:MAG: recombinase RecA [Euryarchaeota archaeon]|nr:recombinase RecA [Euryarchaeota archaeon]
MLSTGIPKLDRMLGGGFIPGTSVVVLGATGIGKTHLGLAFAHAGLKQEGKRGAILDLTMRGDAQRHREYAGRLFGWSLEEAREVEPFSLGDGRLLRLFAGEKAGPRLSRRLPLLLRFLYGSFASGVRRLVVDGIEPLGTVEVQEEALTYIARMVRKRHDWLAREALRERFFSSAGLVEEHSYEPDKITVVYLVTARENLLEELIRRGLSSSGLEANATTVILMGRVVSAGKVKRALYVAKHRGAECSDEIAEFRITEHGLEM